MNRRDIFQFGKALREEREKRGICRKELASILKLSISCLSDLEYSSAIPSPKRAIKIADLLKMQREFWLELALKDSLLKLNLNYRVKLEPLLSSDQNIPRREREAANFLKFGHR